MTRILVTGATGHVGANVVRDLLAHDYEVVPLVRAESNRVALEGLALEPRVGDILDRNSLRSAMEGCDQLIHTAAVYQLWAPDPESIIRPAVEGTRNVLLAAKDAGIERIVCTSSNAAVGYSEDPKRPLDELQWNDRARSPYIRGKTEAERLAFDLATELGLEVVTVLPVGVLGRFDYRKTPTTAGVVDSFAGKGPLIAAATICDVRDVGRAHVLALEKGKPGERYIAGGDTLGMREQADLIEQIGGRRPKLGLPPKAILWPAAAIMEGIAQLTGKPPLVTRASIHDVLGRHFVYDTTKIRKELGLEPRDARTVMEETARWAAFMAWLPSGQNAELRKRYPPETDWVKA